MNIQIVLVGKESLIDSLCHCWHFTNFKTGLRRHNEALTVELNPKRAVIFGVIAGLAFYLLAALGLYAWRRTVPHNHIGLRDILLAPVNFDNIARLQGQTNLDQAEEALRNQRIKDAFHLYRAGVSRLPDNHAARLELAKFYIAANLHEEATNLLIGGLDYGYPDNRDYLTMLLTLTRYDENYPALLRLIPRLLTFPNISDDPETRRILLRLLLRAQLQENDYAGIVDTVDKLQQEPGMANAYSDTAAYALLRMGAADEARDYLDQCDARGLRNDKLLLLRGMLELEQGDTKTARQHFFRLYRDYPEAWSSHLDALLVLRQSERTDDVQALFDLYLSTHRRNPQALAGIAARLADLPDAELVKQIIQFAATDNPPLFGALWFYYVQALITEGRFAEAAKEMDILRQAAPQEGPQAQVFQAFDQIVVTSNARRADEYTRLVEQLSAQRYSPEIYWEAAEAMRKVGAYPTAELILNEGLTEYPYSRPLSALRNRILQDQSQDNARTSEQASRILNRTAETTNASFTRSLSDSLGEDALPSMNKDQLDTFIDNRDLQGFELEKTGD